MLAAGAYRRRPAWLGRGSSRAYEDWQDDQRGAVHDISVHARAMILRNSKGDRDVAHTVEGWYRGDAMKIARAYMMRDAVRARSLCEHFEDLLEQPEFDVGRTGSKDLALIRARPLAASNAATAAGSFAL